MLFRKATGSKKNAESHRLGGRFAPSSPQPSIGLGPSQGAISRHCCCSATGDRGRSHSRLDFLSQTIGLLSRKFRVAISGTIGSRPFDCAFHDEEIEQTSGSPLVAWHAKKRGHVFF